MMKVCLVSAAILVCWAVMIHGNSNVDNAWEEFQAHFPIDAKSAVDHAKRKENFAKVHAAITKHNNHKNSTYKMGHNKFSAMDTHEKKAFIGSHAPKIPANARFLTAEDVPVTRQAAITDYRTNTCMQPVKDQGDCGSCWTFAATAVTEFGKCVKTGTKVALSEQQLVDCSTANYGCDGGWYEEAWKYLANAGGQATAATYPYTAVQGTCKYPGTTKKGATVSTTSPVTYINAGDTTTMINILTNKRLFSVAIAVVDSFFSYASGVYTEPSCDVDILGYHAITVVGHGTLNGVDYWIIRNSWSSGWGAAGYVLFQRGVNLCGVEGSAATTTITG